jgi:acyl-CoA synthetase (AMP-forming)/AMP-acid ligase II
MKIFNHLEQFKSRTALIDSSGQFLSYSRLLSEADSLAEISGRKLIFIICTNSTEVVTAYVGFLRSGNVPILLSHTLAPELFTNLLNRYKPAFMFLPISWTVKLEHFQEQARLGNYILVKTCLEEDYGLHQDLALLLTTSGSTGSPRLVRQTHRNIQSNTDSIIQYLRITCEDKAITTLPMHYTYGLSIVNTHLAAGATIILTDANMMSRRFWQLASEHKATTFGGVPFTYQILKKIGFDSMKLPSLIYLTQAGGRMQEDLRQEFCEICRLRGMRFIVMYGQTEATARMSWLPWEEAERRKESIGLAIPGGRFWLSDELGHPIHEAGKVGELVYEGPNVTMGYAETRHDLTKDDEFQGRLFTGDMAKRDEDGFYYLVGRKKRFIKLFGNRVNLDEVESLLNESGFNCACAGEDDKLRVYVESDRQVLHVKRYLIERLSFNSSAFKIVQVASIPRNESGKVLYTVLMNEPERC